MNFPYPFFSSTSPLSSFVRLPFWYYWMVNFSTEIIALSALLTAKLIHFSTCVVKSAAVPLVIISVRLFKVPSYNADCMMI